ncbi:MAG: hypothetical protein ACTSRG_18145 [Candidatus Helarchaeota archaeon]
MNVKAIGLLSGGLDSTLAIKLMIDQGIQVEAVNFASPFCLCNRHGRCEAIEVADKFNIPIKVINKGEDYLEIVKNPKFGRGKNMNPCIDCRIYMFNKAKEYAIETGAKFIFTGEVLNQRPMSQHLKALKLIEREVSLEEKILRPLSAKLLPETKAEKKGWVDRSKLMDIQGRSRKKQIKFANDINLVDYHCPAGGCLLTNSDFSAKIKDLIRYKSNFKMKDIHLLKIGRHFRYKNNKIIVGRNSTENKKLKILRFNDDYNFETLEVPGPITLLQGPKSQDAIKFAAQLTLRYSDAEKESYVGYGQSIMENRIKTIPIDDKLIKEFRIQAIKKNEKIIHMLIPIS